MEIIKTTRPRNVNLWKTAGILYGDLGTSKAYVLGLAFALAGHSSFWFILAVSILTLLVGINYIKICEFNPNGGGVYSSARRRSKVVSLIGAFFLVSDYIITASLSALSAFYYLGVPYPAMWAIVAIVAVGLLNFLGPKHTGRLSVYLAVPTILTVITLGLLSAPYLPEAVAKLETPSFSLGTDWVIFVGIIVALSGIESIANITGSMRLDRGSTHKNPSVVKTSTPAIMMVVLEVCFFTTLFGLAMNALPGLEVSNGEVSAPGYPNVRDAMLRYMGEVFGGSALGYSFGYYFSLLVSIVFAFLLLSAVNTAIIALISLFFVMSRDEELPEIFQKLNRFGVPHYSTLVAFIAPAVVLMFIHDIAGLASLYAIGFVGAIAINLGATSTNPQIPLKLWERVLMCFTFLIMTAIEITLFIDKPHARGFVVAVIGLGLLLRAIVSEQKETAAIPASMPDVSQIPKLASHETEKEPMLVAVNGPGKTLDFALKEAQQQNRPLYILIVKEQKVLIENEDERVWKYDQKAIDVVDYVINKPDKPSVGFLYTITPSTSHSIIDIAQQKNVKSVIMGRKSGGKFPVPSRFKDRAVKEVSRELPKNMNLIVVY